MPGALLSAGGLAALVYGFAEAGPRGWGDPLVIGLLAAAVVLLALFVAIESRVADPLLPLRVIAHRIRGGAVLVTALMMAALFGCFLFLSYYAQTVLGYTPVQAGLTVMVLVAGSLAGSMLIAGRLLARVSARALIVPGLVAMVAGLLLLSRLTADAAHVLVLYLVPAQILIGVGLGVVLTAATSLATADVSFADTGSASATFNAAQQVGGALGTALFNTVATTVTASYLRSHGTADAATSVVHGFSAALLVSAALMVAATIAAALLLGARSTVARPAPRSG